MNKAKTLLLIPIIAILGYSNTEAQVIEAEKGKVFFGTSLGFGFVNPKKVNENIENHYGGAANIHLAVNFEINAGYFITNEIEVKGVLVAAAALSQVEGKDMIGMENNKLNLLTRLSPEIIGNYHFAQTHYNSFYAGGGLSYNKLALRIGSDDVASSGKAAGFLANIGMLIQNGKRQTCIELKAGIIKDKYDYLNFSGVSLNLGLRF